MLLIREIAVPWEWFVTLPIEIGREMSGGVGEALGIEMEFGT